MPAEQIDVTFPLVIKTLLDAAYKQPNAPSYEFDKRARAALSPRELRSTGVMDIVHPRTVRHGVSRPLHNIEDTYLDGLRHWGLPFNGSQLIDLRRYTPGNFQYLCPDLRGFVDDTGIGVIMSLKSAELQHPLAFKSSDPLRRDYYANLVILAFGSEFELVQRTSFFFYWDHFQRIDCDIRDSVVNSEVKAGDTNKLRELAGFLKRSYARSRLVPYIEEQGVIDSFQPHF